MQNTKCSIAIVFVVTPDGKLYATGYGAGGRLGIGGTDSMTSPTLVESLQHVFIKKVAVNSGGKHCLALTADGDGTYFVTVVKFNRRKKITENVSSNIIFYSTVYSWGEGNRIHIFIRNW